MASEFDATEVFWQAMESFVEHLLSQVQARSDVWAQDYADRHVHDVVVGLLARQATLAGELALNPPIWNDHSAPLFLRSMVENCITIAWILKSPDARAKHFIAYGLGQENLLLEHRKSVLLESGSDPDKDPATVEWERWLNGERYTFLTEVNVGSWGPSLRDMAQEAGLIELYQNDYGRWSGATHNMWHHIVRFNVQHCTNPLHGQHRLPLIPILTPNVEFLQLAARYVDRVIGSFDEATGTSIGDSKAAEALVAELQKMPEHLDLAAGGEE